MNVRLRLTAIKRWGWEEQGARKERRKYKHSVYNSIQREVRTYRDLQSIQGQPLYLLDIYPPSSGEVTLTGNATIT